MEVRKRTIFQAIFCGDIPWNLAMKLSHVAAMWEFGAFCWHQKNLDMHRCRLPPDGEPARWGILTNWKMNTYFMTQILPLFSCYSMLFQIVWWWWWFLIYAWNPKGKPNDSIHHSWLILPWWWHFHHENHHEKSPLDPLSRWPSFCSQQSHGRSLDQIRGDRRSLRGISWGFHDDFNGEIFFLCIVTPPKDRNVQDSDELLFHLIFWRWNRI